MSENEGYIKLYRQILDNPVVCKDSDHIATWIFLLSRATYKNCPAIFNGKKIILNPGQLITGRKKISEKFSISESKVQRILHLFEKEHQIEQQTCNKNRLITIVEWHKYQSTEQQAEQQLNNKRTTTEQQLNTNKKEKKDKNVKKERNIIPPPRNLLEAYIAENHFQVDADRFYDFYESKGWLIGKQRMKDWQAAVRTWSRKENHGDKPDAEPKNGNRQGDYDYSGFFVNGGDF